MSNPSKQSEGLAVVHYLAGELRPRRRAPEDALPTVQPSPRLALGQQPALRRTCSLRPATGDQPIAIVWRLDYALPSEFFAPATLPRAESRP
jgi:hypothetical protein